MDIHRWWSDDPTERFWLEVTNRPDVGADLHAPAFDDAGHENPTYRLICEVKDGDIVFHYEKDSKAITSWSIALGGFWEANTLWGTPRSTGPSGAPVSPYEREGLWHGLHGPFRLDQPLTLDELRESEVAIQSAFESLEQAHGRPLYMPFQLRPDGLRAAQGYLAKMPAGVVAELPKLKVVGDIDVPPPTPADESNFGKAYQEAGIAPQGERDPFAVDPAIVERGLRSHSELQNLLAERVAESGSEPRSPGPQDPPWDLLWERDGAVWIAEVKSLTDRNEERQLRLGLGQLLRYRHTLLERHLGVHAVLMAEREPTDAGWLALCQSLDVLLLWPDQIDRLQI